MDVPGHDARGRADRAAARRAAGAVRAARGLRGAAALAALAALALLLAAPGPTRAQEAEPADGPAAAAPQEPLPPDPSVAENARELQAVRERIKSHRERMAALNDAERDAAGRVRGIEEEVGLVKRLLRNLDARERILQRQIDTLRVRLALHEQDYQARQDEVSRRLRALYVRGARGELESILTAGSYTALIARLKYAATMARLDERLLRRTRAEGQAVLAQQQQLQEALAGIWEAREEARRESGRLAEIEAERQAALRGVRREKQQVQASLTALEANARRLTDLLAALEDRRLGGAEPPPRDTGEQPFTGLQGRLDWPVAGTVVRPFGRSVHPEFKTVTLHNGVSIAAARGTPVYAVAGGSVAFVERLPGYGTCVILDHGEGYYSLYAHTSRTFVQRGERVSRGQVVAEVGEVEGTGAAQLYFEIRRGKTPLDPMPWLKPRR